MKDINRIIRIVEKHAGCSITEKTNKRSVVQYRQIAHYLVDKYTTESQNEIGFRIGERDHSTVNHSKKTVKKLMYLKNYREKFEEIQSEVEKELHVNSSKRTQMIHDLEQRIYGAEHPEHLSQMKSRLGHLLYAELQD